MELGTNAMKHCRHGFRTWNWSYSSLQQDTNAELNKSRASGGYRLASAAQARRAWLGDSFNSVVLKLRSHSCQSSLVDFPLVSQAVLRCTAFISSFFVARSAKGISSTWSTNRGSELRSWGSTSPFCSLLMRRS